MNGRRDALIFLGSWIAFLVMIVSSFVIGGRVRFGWSLTLLVVLGIPAALLTYITRFAGGGLLLATLNLQRWLVEATVPDKLIQNTEIMIFLAALLLASMPVPVIIVVRRHRPARPAVGTPPGSHMPYPPAPPTWPPPDRDDDD